MIPDYNDIAQSLSWLEALIRDRLQHFFQQTDAARRTGIPATEPAPLRLAPTIPQQVQEGSLAHLRTIYALSTEEYALLLMALLPHTAPHLIDTLVQTWLPNGGDFPEIGGVRHSPNRTMLPTGETAQFILGGNDLDLRLQVQALLQGGSILVREKILTLEAVREGDPVMSGRLLLDSDWLTRTLTGTEPRPDFSAEFPAKRITTHMTWEDLILSDHTQRQIADIRTWLRHNGQAMQDEVLGRKLKPGYRVMFHGPSGTGKTLTATLLGRQFEKDVYRIDLSQVVSKYIGETEKNLERIFTRAEHKDWILFFDEADALFGKRTHVQNAHDRYANQEVSYLLQRVEDFPGLIILASNYKNNVDDAFLRRLNAIVHFPPPTPAERDELWRRSLPVSIAADPAIPWKTLSEKYDLTGAAILQVVHFATLKAFSRPGGSISLEDLLEGIKKEYRKEEKTL